MSYLNMPVWKEAPFIRIIIPLLTGILIEWYCELPVWVYKFTLPFCFILILLLIVLKSFTLFNNYWITGLLINILFLGIGGFITYYKDIRHDTNCITHVYQSKNTILVTLTETPAEKRNSFKANASLNLVCFNDTIKKVKGNIVLYFQKDSAVQKLAYNTRLVFRKNLQPIRNSGNPGAFDYKRYCIFQQIFYQVYLKPGDYEFVPDTDHHSFKRFLFTIRTQIITILQTFITGDKEAGLAEALLIGYKDDLDKNLVQLYSNTGVVHIIAISGLHVGLIYWLLDLLLMPLKTSGRLRWVKAVLIISGLWLFSTLTGGSASVCRSALMFSFIVTGENIGRKTNIYNSLAASAFLLLCYNPYWLWDAGFQLSYMAVLSIVVFMKPVYNWFYIKNKFLDYTWKMAAISIAAQVLTTPVSIFHFQQFPNYFLIANLVAVPLSSLVVLAELALCVLAFKPILAIPCGNITTWLIRLMNDFIAYINKMPFTITGDLKLSLEQLFLIYLIIFSAGTWIFQKNKSGFIVAMSLTCCSFILKCYYSISESYQEKLVVYNIPHHTSIDIIRGHQCVFIGDSIPGFNSIFQNFIFRPSRIEYRVKVVKTLPTYPGMPVYFKTGNQQILLVDSSINMKNLASGYAADIIILSGNAPVTANSLQDITGCKKIVLDSSHSYREINKWKNECEKEGIACYSVAEKGAFILNLN